MCTLLTSRVQAPPSLSSCSIHPIGPPSRQGGSSGQGSAHVHLPAFRALSQECQSHPDAFFPLVLSICLYGDLSCSFGCRRDFLPVSSWFSIRVIPHVDVFFFLMYLWEKMSSASSYSAILIFPPGLDLLIPTDTSHLMWAILEGMKPWARQISASEAIIEGTSSRQLFPNILPWDQAKCSPL